MVAGEIVFIALATNAAATAPALKLKEDNLVIIRQERSASIEQAVEHAISGLLAGTATTYQSDPPSVGFDHAPFVSPITSSFIVKAKLKIDGEVVQPPIDLDDVVYFNE